MKIQSILETALYVVDPAVSAAFYRRLFGFATLLESDRLIALDVAGRNILLLFRSGSTASRYDTGTGVIPSHPGSPPTHFAFAIAAEDFERWQTHLQSLGVPIESVVDWPQGARSLYFRDPDGNLAELITPGFWATY
jgi:catechol 2,3-dioxygenase-like lactoylglutathione lyase family enzyme